MIDSIIAGQSLGADGIAAVGFINTGVNLAVSVLCVSCFPADMKLAGLGTKRFSISLAFAIIPDSCLYV
jgi:hypothetical protein